MNKFKAKCDRLGTIYNKYYLLLRRDKTWRVVWAEDGTEARVKATVILVQVNSRGVLISPDGYRAELYPTTQ